MFWWFHSALRRCTTSPYWFRENAGECTEVSIFSAKSLLLVESGYKVSAWASAPLCCLSWAVWHSAFVNMLRSDKHSQRFLLCRQARNVSDHQTELLIPAGKGKMKPKRPRGPRCVSGWVEVETKQAATESTGKTQKKMLWALGTHASSMSNTKLEKSLISKSFVSQVLNSSRLERKHVKDKQDGPQAKQLYIYSHLAEKQLSTHTHGMLCCFGHLAHT